jgi:aldose 1-epimerase
VAGRIKDARALNLEFERNEGRHHLHSGSAGFSHKFFFIESIKDNEVTLVLDDDSSNSGYIGYMIFKVTFILTDQNELIIKYQAVCDKDTLLSPTNHSYFNLEGNNKDVLNHVLNIDAYLVSELDDEYIPTGTLFNVQKNPAFRLNGNKNIEELIRENHPQLLITHNGFDHAYKLNTNKLTLESQNVKIRLIITTDEEAVVVYTSNKLPQKTCILEGNCAFKKYSGIALEAQAMPNKANTESYREILLKKDSVYNSKSTYKFENID